MNKLDGYKIQTVSVLDVEYVKGILPKPKFAVNLKERLQNLRSKLDSTIISDGLESEIAAVKEKLSGANDQLKIRLKPVKFTATISVALDSFSDTRHNISGVKITQILMNSNDATTGYKLQVSQVSSFLGLN